MPIFFVFALWTGSLPALAAQPVSCKTSFYSVAPESALPGDVIRMAGSWGAPAKWKWPSLNKGDSRELKVIAWNEAAIDVQLPEDLSTGTYHLGVYCAWGGQLFSSGWKEYRVLAKDSLRAFPAEVLMGSSGFFSPDYDLPQELAGDALCGEAQRHWMARRHEAGEAAASGAWEAYHGNGNSRGMATALYWRALHREYLGKKKDADGDRRMALDILEYFVADDSPNPSGRSAAISEYCDILDGLFRAALEDRDFKEARRLADKRLEFYLRIKDSGGESVARAQKERAIRAETAAREAERAP